MIAEEIKNELQALSDPSYREFQVKLLPTVDPASVIGVRTPALRKLAKQLIKREDAAEFLDALPHATFDENQLHAFMLSELKDFTRCVSEVDRFLPYIDNWATTDQLSPKVFKKHRAALLPQISTWIASSHTYTIRFAIGLLMEHFLDEEFKISYPEMVAAVRSEEYYVNMMIAWYFATALAKQYDAVLPFLKERRLAVFTHNKTIQKAVESYRITPEQKAFLKGLKIRQ